MSDDDYPGLGLTAWAHPDADLALLDDGPGADKAKELMSRLFDARLLGDAPGHPPKPVFGTCRICARDADLTFEHIPPRSAGNATRARAMSVEDMLVRGADIDFPSNGWTGSQRGAGMHVLCGGCNNGCGLRLVPEYTALALTMIDAMSRQVTTGPDGKPAIAANIDLSLPDFALGNVARQAVAMLLGVSGGAAVSRLHPELARLVLGEQVDPPPGVRLGLALAGYRRVRYAAPTAVGQDDGVTVFAEVAAAPFRWTLSWTGTGLADPLGTTDVTDWLAIPLDQRQPVQVALAVGMIIGSTPGDSRDQATILRERAAHEARAGTPPR